MTRLPHMPTTIWSFKTGVLLLALIAIPAVSYAEKGDRLVPANPLGGSNKWKTDVNEKPPVHTPSPADTTKQNVEPAPAETEPTIETIIESTKPEPETQSAPTPTPAQKPAPAQEATAPAHKPVAPPTGNDRADAIESINNYFNTITYLEGRFLQTDSGNNKTEGNFYVKRPGRIRFDYDAPSNLRIVSDGKWLSIEDPDLSTYDRYPLETTPFKMLLKKDVNLEKDADISDFFVGDDLIIVTLTDKVEKDSGKIKLFFTRPDIQLAEWIITDTQGLDTRVQLKNVIAGKRIKPGFFVVTDDTSSVFQR